MDPRMMEILKKAKAVDKAATKYDNTPIKSKSSSKGLYDDLNIVEESYAPPATYNNPQQYEHLVESSKLPPAIKEAMKKNPIPQASPVDGFALNEEQIREIRGNEIPHYSEDDEVDFYQNPVPKKQTKRTVNEQHNQRPVVGVDPNMIRQIVQEEIKRILPKVAPKIIEHYLQQGLIKENMDILRKIKTK